MLSVLMLSVLMLSNNLCFATAHFGKGLGKQSEAQTNGIKEEKFDFSSIAASMSQLMIKCRPFPEIPQYLIYSEVAVHGSCSSS